MTFGDDVEIKASLTAPDGGLQLFKTDSGTRLALDRISLEISTGGSFGLEADASLTIPKPDGADDAVTTVALSAGIEIELVGVPSITITLQKTGDVWNDAFGVTGLGLGDLAIQGGIVFSTPPTPSIGFGATITSLPESWRKPLGIVGDEPITFVVNISAKHPIFAIELGTADNKPFLEPLKPISDTLGNALAIDDASLVIAPLGGDVGPFHFEPGIHLRFDALIFGVNLNVRADIDPTTGEVDASVKLGSFGFAGITIHDTTFTMDLKPSGGELAFDGGIDLPGAGNVTAKVDTKFTTAGGISFTFDGEAKNLGLSSVLSLGDLHVTASGTLSGLAAPTLSLAAYGSVHLLGTQMTFGGSLVLGAPFGVTGFTLFIGAHPFHIGPVAVGGGGCGDLKGPDGSPTGFVPPPGVPASFVPPSDGLCVTAGFDPTSSSPLTLGISASVSVAGIGVDFTGRLDDTGIALTASVTVAKDAAPLSVDGRLYFGSGLAGLKAPDRNGQLHQVHAGDFTLQGSGHLSLLGFGAEFSVGAGHLGDTEWVHGAAKFDVLGSGIAVAGDFSHDSTGFHWAVSGSGHLTVGGYDLVSVQASASSNANSAGLGTLSIKGSLSLGPLSATVAGSYDDTAPGAPRFSITGTGSLQVFGVGVDASVSVNDLAGPVAVTAHLHGQISSLLTIDGDAQFDTAGHLCVRGSAQVLGGLASADLSYCTPGTANPGFHAHFSVLGLHFDGDFTSKAWSVSASFGPYSGDPSVGFCPAVCADVSFYFQLTITVSSAHGLELTGEGQVDLNLTVAGDSITLLGLSLSVDNEPYDDAGDQEIKACASATALDHTVTACYGTQTGFDASAG